MDRTKNALYNEGFEDGLKHIQKSHVPVKDIAESVDKLLDKINKHSLTDNYILDHFNNNLSIDKVKLENIKEKKLNLDKILDLIKQNNEHKIK